MSSRGSQQPHTTSARRDQREGDGHEGHEGGEHHEVQPQLRVVEGRDGSDKVCEPREGEVLYGDVGAKGSGDGDGKEVAMLRYGGVGITVHELQEEARDGWER